MSKQNRKKEPAPRGGRTSKASRPADRTARSNGRTSKTSSARVVNSRSRVARPTRRQIGMNLSAVRIAAEVVAAAALFGGVAWALSARGSYNVGVIAGLVILGLLAGLGLVTALRPAEVIRRVNRLARR